MRRRKDLERPLSSESERSSLAQRLREAREYLGLSQEYVSQQTGIPRPAISEIEAGRRRVESTELRKLAALYGRPLSYFLPTADPAMESLETGAATPDPIEMKLRTMTKDLPIEDREEILRFAEYLRHRQEASQSQTPKRNERDL